MLEAKLRLGVFVHPCVDEQAAKVVLDRLDHRVTARLAAERTAMLLRNEGGLLPLNRQSLKSIAVIGALADSPRETVGP